MFFAASLNCTILACRNFAAFLFLHLLRVTLLFTSPFDGQTELFTSPSPLAMGSGGAL